MTLSEFIEQSKNKDYYASAGKRLKDTWNGKVKHAAWSAANAGRMDGLNENDYAEITNDMYESIDDETGPVVYAVIRDWADTLPLDPEDNRSPLNAQITPEDVESITKLLGIAPKYAIKHVYQKMQGVITKYNLKPSASFVKGLLDQGLEPARAVKTDLRTKPEMASLLDHVMSLPDDHKGKSSAATSLVENPAVKPPKVLDVLRSVVQGDGPHSSVLFESMKEKLGERVYQAEMDKIPVTHPIHYIQGISSLQNRSSEEIQQHIDHYNRMKRISENIKDSSVEEYRELKDFERGIGRAPWGPSIGILNDKITKSPNFAFDHLKSYPEQYFSGTGDMPSRFPSLEAKVPENELRSVFDRQGQHAYDPYGGVRPVFASMLDMSSNGGRPMEEAVLGFQEFSKNPTFVADVSDIPQMGDDHSLVEPKRMTPELQQFFQDMKPVYDVWSKADSIAQKDEAVKMANEVNKKYGGKGAANVKGIAYALENFLPVMSHVDPYFTSRMLDSANEGFWQEGILKTREIRNKMNPEALNGMTNGGNLYKAVSMLGLPPSLLDQKGQEVAKQGFLASLPDIEQKFAHFHDAHRWNYPHGSDLSNAANFGSLGEYFKHVGGSVKHRVLQVKRGSGTLRALRDYLEQAKERGVQSINPRDLPKDKTWNSVYQTLVTQNRDGSTTESKTIDWNPLRGKDGNVSAETVQAYIDRMQPIRLHATETQWDGAQRHNDKHSNVVVFGLGDDHVAKLKAAGVWEDYQKVANSLPQGHPQHPYALGWVRYTLADRAKGSHVFIDEVQNDVGKQLHNNSEIKDESKKKIMDILYDGSHPSDMLHEAFHEYARSKKWHNRPFVIHSPESKKPISLSKQNDPVPVHYKKTYEEIVKQRFHAEPSTYGERKGETHQDIQGKPVWTGTIRKFEDMVAIPVSNGYSDWE